MKIDHAYRAPARWHLPDVGGAVRRWETSLLSLPVARRSAVLAALLVVSSVLWLVLWTLGAGALLPGTSTTLRWLVAIAGLLLLTPAVASLLTMRHLTALEARSSRFESQRDRYERFFRSADEVFLVCDLLGRLRLINPAGLRLLGRDPVWEKLTIQQLAGPDQEDRLEELLALESLEQDRRSVSLDLVDHEGKTRPFEVEALVCRDVDGDPASIQCCLRPRVEDPIEELSEESDVPFRSLIEQFPEGVALLTNDGRVLLSNHLGEDYLADYGTFLAERRLVLFGGIPIERLVADGDTSRRQEIIVREPYNQILEVHGRRIPGNGSDRTLLVIRDMTTEKQRRDRLERSDRLAAVGQLAAGIAHDFKNILQGINLCADLSRSGDLSPAEHRDSMLTIIEQAQRGSKMIQQIMDFTRQSESTQRLLDLGELLQETRELLEPGVPENIVFEVEVLEEDGAPVMADPGQLQQVLANLILNARDAMPDGGRLSVALTRVGGPADSGPAPPELAAGDWLRISVSDTGSGIPKSVKHRVFEPFFTTKATRGGTGLGLAQVYGNVQQHGGLIEFETQEGVGTTFSVFLPMYRHHMVAASQAQEAAESPRGSGETILVVEDEIAVLTATCQSLRSLGYRVLEAVDGRDALEMLQAHRDVQLVLSDVRMPGIDGLQLVAELRRLRPEIKVLLMTGYSSQLARRPGRPSGVDGVLAKPFSMAHLAREVHRTLLSSPSESEQQESS